MKESEIEEFYVVQFSPNDKFIAAGGKRKNRHKWDKNDNDNSILPCHLKVYIRNDKILIERYLMYWKVKLLHH